MKMYYNKKEIILVQTMCNDDYDITVTIWSYLMCLHINHFKDETHNKSFRSHWKITNLFELYTKFLN